MMELPVGKPGEEQKIDCPAVPFQPDITGLTKCQVEVGRLLVKGMDNQEMGRRLFVEKRTVEFHVCALMRAFQVPTRYKLICALYDAGWR